MAPAIWWNNPAGEVRQTCKFKIPRKCCYIHLNKNCGDTEEDGGRLHLENLNGSWRMTHGGKKGCALPRNSHLLSGRWNGARCCAGTTGHGFGNRWNSERTLDLDLQTMGSHRKFCNRKMASALYLIAAMHFEMRRTLCTCKLFYCYAFFSLVIMSFLPPFGLRASLDTISI